MSIPKVSVRLVKAARSLLGWSQERLAEASNVSAPTIKRLEAEQYGELGGRDETIAKIQLALESAGIEFTNGKQPGVRMKMGTISCPVCNRMAKDRTPTGFDGLKIDCPSCGKYAIARTASPRFRSLDSELRRGALKMAKKHRSEELYPTITTLELKPYRDASAAS